MTTDPEAEIYVPRDDDEDSELLSVMQQGRADIDPNNDLRDPWFHTPEGQQWLAEKGEHHGV